MEQKPIPVDQAAQALHEALGAVLIALCDTMPFEQKDKFAHNLARLARNAEAQGNTILETVLIDLHNAASR
ncbi:MAG: hypothetical protein ACR2JA_14045 [Hydrogenophaga sp.]|uniref:hypothetical protein n=1 Tax=Hydrogenophaga sp. TaxID=1904254 RepID=UPI003D9B0ACF